MTNPFVTFCGVYRNEGQRVRQVLNLARDLSLPIVVAVQDSDDNTAQICREYTGDIIYRPAEGPEASKDFVMEQVKTPWTFWLDADEYPSYKMIKFVRDFTPYLYERNDAVSFNRINYVDGIIVGGGQGPDRQFRMMRNTVRWNVEEQGRSIHIHPQVTNPVNDINTIYHYRSLDKVKRQTERWNELCEDTQDACNQYVRKVEEELKWKTGKK